MAKNPQLKDKFSDMVSYIPGLLGPGRSSIIAVVLRNVEKGSCSAQTAIEMIGVEMRKSEPHRAGKEIILDPDDPMDWALIGVYGGPAQVRGVAAEAKKNPGAYAAPVIA